MSVLDSTLHPTTKGFDIPSSYKKIKYTTLHRGRFCVCVCVFMCV